MKRLALLLALTLSLALTVPLGGCANLTPQDKAMILDAGYQTTLTALDFASRQGALSAGEAQQIQTALTTAKQAYTAYLAAKSAGGSTLAASLSAFSSALQQLDALVPVKKAKALKSQAVQPTAPARVSPTTTPVTWL